jgi:transcription antitermination factor NusG
MASLYDTRSWYVVYTKPHKEESALFHLHLKGVKVFFPRLFLLPPLRVRKQLIPLFPNYLFVWVRLPEEYDCVTWTPGVKRFVCFNDNPAPLEQGIVTYLMEQANSQGVITARANLTVGQEVRISGGPFDGITGIIQEPPNARGRVKVLMELLSRPMKVDVPLELLKTGGVTYPITVGVAHGS